jgi:hypothetical protein
MTEADRVHSTPPINTSSTNPKPAPLCQCMTCLAEGELSPHRRCLTEARQAEADYWLQRWQANRTLPPHKRLEGDL